MATKRRIFQVFEALDQGDTIEGVAWPFRPAADLPYNIRTVENAARGATTLEVDVFAGDSSDPVAAGTVSLGLDPGTRLTFGGETHDLVNAVTWEIATEGELARSLWDPDNYLGAGARGDFLEGADGRWWQFASPESVTLLTANPDFVQYDAFNKPPDARLEASFLRVVEGAMTGREIVTALFANVAKFSNFSELIPNTQHPRHADLLAGRIYRARPADRTTAEVSSEETRVGPCYWYSAGQGLAFGGGVISNFPPRQTPFRGVDITGLGGGILPVRLRLGSASVGPYFEGGERVHYYHLKYSLSGHWAWMPATSPFAADGTFAAATTFKCFQSEPILAGGVAAATKTLNYAQGDPGCIFFPIRWSIDRTYQHLYGDDRDDFTPQLRDIQAIEPVSLPGFRALFDDMRSALGEYFQSFGSDFGTSRLWAVELPSPDRGTVSAALPVASNPRYRATLPPQAGDVVPTSAYARFRVSAPANGFYAMTLQQAAQSPQSILDDPLNIPDFRFNRGWSWGFFRASSARGEDGSNIGFGAIQDGVFEQSDFAWGERWTGAAIPFTGATDPEAELEGLRPDPDAPPTIDGPAGPDIGPQQSIFPALRFLPLSAAGETQDIRRAHALAYAPQLLNADPTRRTLHLLTALGSPVRAGVALTLLELIAARVEEADNVWGRVIRESAANRPVVSYGRVNPRDRAEDRRDIIQEDVVQRIELALSPADRIKAGALVRDPEGRVWRIIRIAERRARPNVNVTAERRLAGERVASPYGSYPVLLSTTPEGTEDDT